MKTQERTLFHEDESLLNIICHDLKELKPLLINLKNTYESLTIGNFDNTVFKSIVSSGAPKTIAVFYEKLNKQLDAMNITSSIIRDKMIADHEGLITNFKVAVNNLIAFQPLDIIRRIGDRTVWLNPSQVSYENNDFKICSEDKESILEEHCRTYLTNEEEHDLLNGLNDFIDAYKKLKAIMLENNFSDGFRLSHLQNCVIEGEANNMLYSTKVELNEKVFMGLLKRAKYFKNKS